MSQLTGSFKVETDRLSREVAAAVVAELDRVDLVAALADAVVRRMAADQPAGSQVYERDPGSPDPGASPRHRGAGFGGLGPDGTLTYENGDQA